MERHISQKTGRNDPCPCGSGKKHKKCCLGKDALPENNMFSEGSSGEEESISCHECGKPMGPKPENYFCISTNNGEKIYFCSVCYREMACGICGTKLELKSFAISRCADCGHINIECRDCITDRIKWQKNIPYWKKIRVRGLKRRSRALIRASLAEELELDPEKI